MLLALILAGIMPLLGAGPVSPISTPSPTPAPPAIAQTAAESGVSTCLTSNPTTALGAQPAVNDLILIQVLSSTTGTLSPPAGFNTKDTQTNSLHFSEWWKYSTGSDGTSWSYADSIGNGSCVALVYDIKFVNQTNPFDNHGVNLSTLNASAGPYSTPSLTPTVLNDLPLIMLNTGTSSMTVLSLSPVAITLAGNDARFTTRWYYDSPLSSLTAYVASMTMTGNNAFAHQINVLDLIAPATSATAAPSPTPSPTPAAGTYSYHGCQVYNGTAGTADPIANANVSATSIDSNSATVISHLSSVAFSGSNTAGLEIVNLATTSTPLFTVATNGGHNPPITSGIHGGGAGAQFPWQSSPVAFLFEGTIQTNCTGDCHHTTLNTQTCTLYEGGGGNFNGTTFSTYNGFIDLLTDTYDNQYSNKSDNWGVAGFGGLGWVYYGEDFSLSSINHPGFLSVPETSMIPGSNGVNYSHGVGSGAGSCSGGAAACLELGDGLRLKSSFTCPVDAKAALICNAAKNYAWFIGDTNGGSSIQVFAGRDTNGVDDSDAAVWTFIGGLTLSNFDIISRTALVP